MNSQFITFRKFNDPALAEELTVLLKENDIPFLVEEEILSFDPTFASSAETAKDYLIKLKPEDFTKADAAINEAESRNLDGVESDYYLFNFTNEELTEVITQTDEWSNFDQVLARKILAERGTDIDEQKIDELKQARIEELKQPEEHQPATLAWGYFFAILGGLFGLVIGWRLAYLKKTLPNGESLYVYNENDRRHGRIIFTISIVTFSITLIAKMINRYYDI